MNIREQRNCAECGGLIPSKNKQDCCDDCIAQLADKKEAAIKIVGGALLGTAVGIIMKILTKRK